MTDENINIGVRAPTEDHIDAIEYLLSQLTARLAVATGEPFEYLDLLSSNAEKKTMFKGTKVIEVHSIMVESARNFIQYEIDNPRQ